MARAKKHKDVEFHVEVGGDTVVFETFAEAAARAVDRSMSEGRTALLDVVVLSKAGAKWLGGDHGVAMYEEDPEASVFERIEVNASSLGRVP